MTIAPIEIAAKPWSNHKRSAENNVRSSIVRLGIINLVGLILRHVNGIWIDGNDFDVTVVVDDLLLRGGLEVAQVVGIGTQFLNGIHDVLLLVLEGFAQLRGPV